MYWRPGNNSSYTGLPRPSQCSNSFWPSRGCGGSGLIFAVGVSVEKEMVSLQDSHSVQEIALISKASCHTPQLPPLMPREFMWLRTKTWLPLCLVNKERNCHGTWEALMLPPGRGRALQGLSLVRTQVMCNRELKRHATDSSVPCTLLSA